MVMQAAQLIDPPPDSVIWVHDGYQPVFDQLKGLVTFADRERYQPPLEKFYEELRKLNMPEQLVGNPRRTPYLQLSASDPSSDYDESSDDEDWTGGDRSMFDDSLFLGGQEAARSGPLGIYLGHRHEEALSDSSTLNPVEHGVGGEKEKAHSNTLTQRMRLPMRNLFKTRYHIRPFSVRPSIWHPRGRSGRERTG